MCVIVVYNEKPALEEVRNICLANPDGVGFSWVENRTLHFKKGMYPCNQAFEQIENLPLPFLFHARIATSGGTHRSLCHPFIVGNQGKTETDGIAKRVLFHNGHIDGWRQFLAGINIKCKGPMSDSRAIAIAIGSTHESYLHLLSGKFAVMDRQGIRLYGDFRLEGKNLYSNFFWKAQKIYFPNYDSLPVSRYRPLLGNVPGLHGEEPKEIKHCGCCRAPLPEYNGNVFCSECMPESVRD